MFARKFIPLFMALLFVFAAGVAHAGLARTYAVYPFEINGPSQYKYLSRGVQSMLATRLNWTGHFEPLPGSKKLKAADRPSTKVEEIKAAQRLGVDYLVLGSIMIAGDDATVDTRVVNKEGKVWTKNTKTSINELIPSLDALSKGIQNELFEKPGKTAAQIEQDRKKEEAKPEGPNNPYIVHASTAGKVVESKINPQFRYEGGTSTPGTWRSQSLNMVNLGGVVGDVTGDGKSDFVFLSDTSVSVYSGKQQRLQKVCEHNVFKRADPLRISGIDFDRDGVMEVVVSTLRDERPNSVILSFKGGKVTILKDNIDLFLSVVRMPPNFTPALIGQKMSRARKFYSKDVTEYMLSGNDLMPVRKLKVPEFTNVFNLAYLPEGDGYKVIVINKYGNVTVYSKDLEPLYQSSTSFNSTPIKVERGSNFTGLRRQSEKSRMESYLFIPMPVVVTTITDPKKQEVLLNKDISVAAQVFSNYKSFSQGEIHSEYWDGVGLNLAWKTRRIKGTVTSYGMGDVDNDGKDELYCMLNTYPGAMGVKFRKTFVLAYDLTLPAQ